MKLHTTPAQEAQSLELRKNYDKGAKKMTTVMNPYEALYTNLKNQFTVIYNGAECSVGDFMLMKSNKRTESSLPIVASSAKSVSIASIVEYVNDKLTVKRAPAKDRTIRKFPFRTSLSAMLSATAVCAIVLSCGILALSGKQTSLPYTAEKNEEAYVESVTPSEDEDTEETFEYEVEKN